MAALVAGVQYGLSSHSNFHENKSLIFVKLTDSAQRAIEDFLRNRNKTSQNPTIQFLGNEGQLSFPSTQSSHGSAGFTFSLSGNQDIEGPQGGFECIQQTGPQSLESLGALPCKMRIQANDDVYETTRHRMAVAEENNKNKCTRVIKANGPDIGRKVKVKGTGRTIPPPSNSRHRESASSIPASNSSQLRLSSSYKPIASNPPPVRNQPEKKVSDIMRRPLKERLIHLLALRPYKKPELYDRINREGIKERERSIITTILKQVAFMRDNTYHLHRYVWNDVQEDWPYYTEQEKAMLKRRKPQNLTPPGSSDGGSSGSGQSPNSTHPGSPPSITAPPPSLLSSKRPGYYQGNDGLPTKRPRISHYKKPEPGSSNTGSSEHGRTAANSNSNGVNSVFGGGTAGSSASASSAGGGGGGSGGSGGFVSASENWEQRQQQRERRTDYRAERTANGDVLRNSGGYAASKPCLLQSPNSPSDSEDNNVQNVHRNANATNATGNSASSQGSHNSHSNVAHNSNSSSSSGRHSHHHHHHHNGNASGGNSAGGKSTVGSVNNPGDGGNTATAASGVDYNNTRNVPSAASSAGDHSGSASRAAYADRRDRTDRNERIDRTDRLDREQHVERVRDTRPAARPNAYNDVSNVPPTSSDPAVTSSSIDLEAPESPDSSEYPDYLTYYTTISSQEQRRRYKAEFNANYEEYRKVHELVAKVSKRFAQLQERLRQEQNSQNWRAFEEIRAQIVSEYDMTKKDPVHIATKRRFHYLHEKLSHIKRLVCEYDSQHYTDGKTANTGDNNSKGTENDSGRNGINDIDSLHY